MNENYTHIAVVLDSSGSMQKTKADTIGGFNSFIEEQKKVKTKVRFSMLSFSDRTHWLHANKDMEEVKPLDSHTYTPCGNTALYDAMGEMIDTLGQRFAKLPENEQPAKVVILVLTDGEENSSREYRREAVASKVKHQQDKYNWQIIFMGANQDAVLTAEALEVKTSSAITFSQSSLGTKQLFRDVSLQVSNYAGGAATMDYMSANANQAQILKDEIKSN